MKKKLLPFFIFSIVPVFLHSCITLKEPVFQRIENVKPQKLSLHESLLNLEIVYFNPNNSKLKLRKAAGEAWIEDNFLGNFSIDTLINIPAKGNFKLPVNLKMDMSKILKTSILAFLNPEVIIKVTGNARVGKSFLFINYPIKYEGKQNFKELLK